MTFRNRQRKTVLSHDTHYEAARSRSVSDKTQVYITREDSPLHLIAIRNNDLSLQIRGFVLEAREPFWEHVHPCGTGRNPKPFLRSGYSPQEHILGVFQRLHHHLLVLFQHLTCLGEIETSTYSAKHLYSQQCLDHGNLLRDVLL